MAGVLQHPTSPSCISSETFGTPPDRRSSLAGPTHRLSNPGVLPGVRVRIHTGFSDLNKKVTDMQYQHIGHRIKGFYKIANLANKMEAIMSTTAQQKYDALLFWEKHGLDATLDAFKVSRRTLYRWRQILREAGHNVAALVPRSTAPHRRRKAQRPPGLVQEIRRLRKDYPNLGKQPLQKLLEPWCVRHGLATPSVSTIGRIIAAAPDKMRRIPQRLDNRGRPKSSRQINKSRCPPCPCTAPLEWFACDTVERVRDGIRRYVFTFIDPRSRVAFAWASTSRSSRRSAHALRLLRELVPRPIHYILSDNGSEFMKDFEAELKRRRITHWWTYPKSPKMNSCCERFNRTLQESFVDYHEDLLFADVAYFNRELAQWLVFYNTQRPHHSLGLQSPIQSLLTHHPECQMLWTYTASPKRKRSPEMLRRSSGPCIW